MPPRVLRAAALMLLTSACSTQPVEHVPAPTTAASVALSGTLEVPAPWAVPGGDGSCTADVRTTPFDAASEVLLEGQDGVARWQVGQTTLGDGTLRGTSCVFNVSMAAPPLDAATTYRLTVMSSTRSLVVSWDYPAGVVRSGAPLAMPMTDKLLRY